MYIDDNTIYKAFKNGYGVVIKDKKENPNKKYMDISDLYALLPTREIDIERDKELQERLEKDRDINNKMFNAYMTLSEKEKNIIDLLYIERKQQKEIRYILGISDRSIRKTRAIAFKKMAAAFNNL